MLDWRSEASTLAALQLSESQWGEFVVTGDDEFKEMCVRLAAEYGIRITNPELHNRIGEQRTRLQPELAPLAIPSGNEPTRAPADAIAPDPAPTPEPEAPAEPDRAEHIQTREMAPLTQVIAQITWDRLWGTKRTGRTRAERHVWIRRKLVEQEGTGLGTGRKLDLAAKRVAQSVDYWQGNYFGHDAAGEPLPRPTPDDGWFAEDFAARGGPIQWIKWTATNVIREHVPLQVAEIKHRVERVEDIEPERTRDAPAPTPASMPQPRDGPDWGPGPGNAREMGACSAQRPITCCFGQIRSDRTAGARAPPHRAEKSRYPSSVTARADSQSFC